MRSDRLEPWRLPAMLLLSLALIACSNTNLGDIDESVDSREQMPGPGIFADESGKSSLSWSSENDSAGSGIPAPAPAPVDEKTEFEQFKAWQEMRSQGADSPEYREFLQWLEYRKFKASQN